MHLVKMTMKWPSSMIGRGPKMFRYKIHWKLTHKKIEVHFVSPIEHDILLNNYTKDSPENQ